MKITIIKPKTKITMKMLTDNLIRPRPTIYNLTSDICLLTSVRYRLHFHQEKDSNADYPYMPNEPNLQSSRLTVTLDMIRTYNDNCRKKHKKNEPKTHQKRTKTNQNEPNSTPKTTKYPFQTQSKLIFQRIHMPFQILLFVVIIWCQNQPILTGDWDCDL